MRKAAMLKADASGIFSSPALQGAALISNDGPAVHDPHAGGSLLAALQGNAPAPSGNPAVQAESVQ